jgi:hypothetical protein
LTLHHQNRPKPIPKNTNNKVSEYHDGKQRTTTPLPHHSHLHTYNNNLPNDQAANNRTTNLGSASLSTSQQTNICNHNRKDASGGATATLNINDELNNRASTHPP